MTRASADTGTDEAMSDTSRPARILLLYMESTGAGHRRAAEAIAAELRPHDRLEVELQNISEFMSEPVHEAYRSFRSRIMQEAPHVFGQVYSWYDHERDQRSFLDRLLFSLEKQSLRGLVKFLRDSEHDLVIQTHFFPAEITAHLRRSGDVRLPQMVVTTDYFSHAMWFHEPCERFFVATEDAAVYLNHLGASEEVIEVSGIPVGADFVKRRRDEAAHAAETERRLSRIAAGKRRPRVALMASGTSPDAAREALEGLTAARRAIEVIALAGGNADRRRAMEAVEVPSRHSVRVLGPTDAVAATIEDSDLLVGKAGGLTSAEAMTLGCPMAILRPRPDQEEQNTDVLLENGAAVRIFRPALLASKLDRLFEESARWSELRAAAHRFGRPDAAQRVAAAVLQQTAR